MKPAERITGCFFRAYESEREIRGGGKVRGKGKDRQEYQTIAILIKRRHHFVDRHELGAGRDVLRPGLWDDAQKLRQLWSIEW